MSTVKPLKPEKTPTIIEFASAIGVSKSQVSTAFSGNGRISPKTRHSILEAAKEMGFEPNPHAQRIKGRSSRMIGIFSLDRDLGAGSLKIRRIQSVLNQSGYEVPLYGYENGGEWELERQIDIIDGLCRQRPAAIVYHGGSIKPKALAGLWKYQESGGLVVRYGPEADVPCDQLIYSVPEGIADAARHVIALGHQQIALGHPFYYTNSSNSWVSAFTRVLEEAGLAVRPEWIMETPAGYEDSGAELSRQFLLLKRRPTAICIVNDRVAATFVHHLLHAQVKVPDQLSVVSYDDLPAARCCVVPLTAVAHPIDAIGEGVARLVLSRLEGHYTGPPRRETVHGGLIQRQSSAPPLSL